MLYPPEVAAPFIMEEEGFAGLAYQCGKGVWTIGYGHTRGVKEGDAVTRSEGYKLLDEDLKEAQENLATLVKIPVTKNQFIALMSFVFNFGLTKCRGYRLFGMINRGETENIKTWWPKYCDPKNPKVTDGLKKRRLRELQLFFS